MGRRPSLLDEWCALCEARTCLGSARDATPAPRRGEPSRSRARGARGAHGPPPGPSVLLPPRRLAVRAQPAPSQKAQGIRDGQRSPEFCEPPDLRPRPAHRPAGNQQERGVSGLFRFSLETCVRRRGRRRANIIQLRSVFPSITHLSDRNGRADMEPLQSEKDTVSIVAAGKRGGAKSGSVGKRRPGLGPRSSPTREPKRIHLFSGFI